MTSPPSPAPGLVPTVALYTLARLGLVAVITLVLTLFGVPAIVAVLVALIVALPLSMVLFRGLRSRLDAAIAEVNRRRAVEREALRSRLRGE
jgi:tetrahydromethanopterin S-methyltransferase subunit C